MDIQPHALKIGRRTVHAARIMGTVTDFQASAGGNFVSNGNSVIAHSIFLAIVDQTGNSGTFSFPCGGMRFLPGHLAEIVLIYDDEGFPFPLFLMNRATNRFQHIPLPENVARQVGVYSDFTPLSHWSFEDWLGLQRLHLTPTIGLLGFAYTIASVNFIVYAAEKKWLPDWLCIFLFIVFIPAFIITNRYLIRYPKYVASQKIVTSIVQQLRELSKN